MHQLFGFLSGLISLFSYSLYVYTIWRGNTRPSKSSWWILTVVWTVTFLSSYSIGGSESGNAWQSIVTKWLPISYIVGSLAIAISTIWRGQREIWTLTDTLCVVFAGISLFLFLTGGPFVALICSLFADFFGLFPTIKNAWNHPESEDKIAWSITAFATIVGLFAVPVWSFESLSVANWLSTVYLVVADIAVTMIIFIRSSHTKNIPL